MTKKVVKYDATHPTFPEVDKRCMLWPLDHPDTARVSNTQWAMTSKVVRIMEDGVFETQNSIYVPAFQAT